MYSLRRRLILVLAIGFAVLIAGTGLYLQSYLRQRVTEEFDAVLMAKAGALLSLTEQEEGNIEFDYEGGIPAFERPDHPDYFQIWLDDGRPLDRSSRLGRDLPFLASPTPEPRFHDLPLPDGRPGRAVQLAFVPPLPEEDGAKEPEQKGPLTIVLAVASSRERLDQLLARTRLTLLAAGGAAVLLGAVLAWRALAAGFRPIDSIASQVERLDAESLGERIGLPRAPRELAPIVEQLNALLGRLDATFQRERRFTGNVAHELRTPIAELRSLAEVGGKWPDDPDSVRGFFGDVHDIAGRMERTVTDLLLLARCQAGVERVETQPANVRKIVEAAWSQLAPLADRRKTRLSLDAPEDLAVESDPDKLGHIVANLLENALTYSPAGSEVVCSAAADGAGFRLEVRNPAAPLDAADLERLTEPFWQKDESRSSGTHSGLGLALVDALARLLGLDLRFDQDQNGTFRARLATRALAP